MFEHFRNRLHDARDRRAWDGDGIGERHGFGRHGGRPFGGRGGRGGRFFEHGALRLLVLALIVEQPRHGYEIIKDIEDRVGGAYTPSAGVVYPTLTLLEETGQIEVISSEGNKKLFAATDAGRATVEANRAQVDGLFERMNAAGSARADERDPRIVRAIENLRLALRLKLQTRRLDDAGIAALAALLDETVGRIEKL